MNNQKSLIFVLLPVFVAGLILPLSAHAKTGKPWAEFEKTEERYKSLSKDYKKLAKAVSGDKAKLLEKLSDNYDEMADIKEDAAKDMRKGKLDKFDWSEYEKLSRENQEIEAKLGLNKKHDHKKDYSSKRYYKPDFKDKTKDKEKRLEELEKLLEEKERLIDEKKKLLEKD